MTIEDKVIERMESIHKSMNDYINKKLTNPELYLEALGSIHLSKDSIIKYQDLANVYLLLKIAELELQIKGEIPVKTYQNESNKNTD